MINEPIHLYGSCYHTPSGDHFALYNYVHVHVDSPLEEGSKVTGCVLDVDLLECCLVLSLNPQLVATSTVTPTPKKKGRKAAGAKVKLADLQPGSTLLARVEHKTQHYFILCCTTISGSCLAYGVVDTVSHMMLLMCFYRDFKDLHYILWTGTNWSVTLSFQKH